MPRDGRGEGRARDQYDARSSPGAKIGPHVAQMRENLPPALQIPSRAWMRRRRMEHGFSRRGEGIAEWPLASVILPLDETHATLMLLTFSR